MSKKEEMDEVERKVKKCKNCVLYKKRSNPVVGIGNLNAKILFIGEAPGRNEDIQGKPFVGRAGKILDELLESIDLKRNDIYIANILKSRPPKNRNPLKSEIETCTGYLDKQIRIIQPKVIAPLGNFATLYIFNKFDLKFDKISKIHGKISNTTSKFGHIIVIPLFHPAVATYNSNKKTTLIDDFKIIKKIIED